LDSRLGLSIFADDCKFYFEIASIDDCHFLQENLRRLKDYCERFKLQLNIDKCQKITFTRNPSKQIKFNYIIDSQAVVEVESVKDLGVLLDSKLSFNDHINHIYNKSIKMLGYLFRTCGDFRDVDALKSVYSAIVRSHLDYCSQIYNPVQQNKILLLEKIQRRFTRFLFAKRIINVPDLTEFHYSPVLNAINLESLQSRRNRSDMILLLRVLFGRINCVSLEAYYRAPSTNYSLRSHRNLNPALNNSSSINRCIQLLNSLHLDFEFLLNGGLNAAIATVNELFV